MPIVLQESLRAVFYAPFYAAFALRAYEAEGVDVRFQPKPLPSDAATALLDGAADVVWGGPMRVIATRERVPGCDLVCFCEVVTRDPFIVVGRDPRPEFRLADLDDVSLATVSEVPTPWMCLQEDLRRDGIDPARLRRIGDRGMAENAAALRRGDVDAIQVFEPFIETLLAERAAHIWYAAATRGPASYTTFYAARPLLETRRAELRRMVRAVYRVQKWVAAAEPETMAEVVASFFPELEPPHLVGALARYKRLGIWGRNPRLPRGGYQRLAAGLVSGGLVRAAASYEEAVDNSLAEEVIADDPPPIRVG